MLPESVLNHPYFHNNLDVKSATKMLSSTSSGNFLFCKREKPDEFALIYKAAFRGNERIDFLTIKVSNYQNELINYGNLVVNFMGRHTNLYAIAQSLPQHIAKQGGDLFIPVSCSIPVACSSTDVIDVSGPLGQEIRFSNDYIEQKENIAEKVQKLTSLFSSIQKQMPLARSGMPDLLQWISHAGYVIHSPQQYSGEKFIVDIISPEYGHATVFFSEKNIELLGGCVGSRLLDDPNLLDGLLDVCRVTSIKRIQPAIEPQSSVTIEKPTPAPFHKLFSNPSTSVTKQRSKTTESYQITKNAMLTFTDEGRSLGVHMELYCNGAKIEGLWVDQKTQQQVISLLNSPKELIMKLRKWGASASKIANFIESELKNTPEASHDIAVEKVAAKLLKVPKKSVSTPVVISPKIDLEGFYIEYNRAYRTLTLYKKAKDMLYEKDVGFIIVNEDKIPELTSFFKAHADNSNQQAIMIAFSKLFPLEGNFGKMISVLDGHFNIGLLPKGQPLFKSAVEIKADANKALYKAFLSGNKQEVLALLEKHKDLNLQPDQTSVSATIKSGNIELLNLLEVAFNLKPINSSSNIMDAIESKNIDMLRLISSTCKGRYRERNDLTWAAARTGKIEILRFCIEELGIQADTGTLYDAVRSGEIGLVKYLVEERGISDVDDALQFSLENNYQEISDYLGGIKLNQNKPAP